TKPYQKQKFNPAVGWASHPTNRPICLNKKLLKYNGLTPTAFGWLGSPSYGRIKFFVSVMVLQGFLNVRALRIAPYGTRCKTPFFTFYTPFMLNFITN
ncbi:MAG: hypothetical protein IK065_06040, partial [Neisseriaceae bacterium]|nr:hypothetical protein [Neisseriaceae bacterium]